MPLTLSRGELLRSANFIAGEWLPPRPAHAGRDRSRPPAN
jgi:hypothetical protein